MLKSKEALFDQIKLVILLLFKYYFLPFRTEYHNAIIEKRNQNPSFENSSYTFLCSC